MYECFSCFLCYKIFVWMQGIYGRVEIAGPEGFRELVMML